MKTLLYKEFRLGITPLFYLSLLFSLLLLIPQWVFLLVPMYFLFTVVPNIFAIAKAQNDIVFSAMMPVRRRDIVKARIASVVILELAQVMMIVIFSVIHQKLYSAGNFLMEPNAAYIGCVFLMYGIFNLVFFPMFYRTAYKIGVPVIAGIAAAVVFSILAEFVIQAVPPLRVLGGRDHIGAQLAVTAGGAAVSALLSIAAYRMSAKRFERIGL
jgi:hypothetical protein